MRQIRYRTDYLTPKPPEAEKPKNYMYYTLEGVLESIKGNQRRGQGYFPSQAREGDRWLIN